MPKIREELQMVSQNTVVRPLEGASIYYKWDTTSNKGYLKLLHSNGVEETIFTGELDLSSLGSAVPVEVVNALPNSGDIGKIYLVANSSGENNNSYNEYLYISNSWEKIGGVTIDLTDYATKSWVQSQGYSTNGGSGSGSVDLTGYATENWVNEQGFLKNHQSIKTVTGKSLLGTGNVSISYNDLTNKPSLATVATSGSYNDLTDKPTFSGGQIQADWSQSDSSASDYIKNKPNLATVATSGSYNDLTNKPVIPNAVYSYQEPDNPVEGMLWIFPAY